MADVIELIMADHRRIHRLHEVLEDAVRRGPASGSGLRLAPVWDRLVDLLAAHTQAEEEICFLPMCGSGVLPGGWRREAVADHEDIREAIGEATLQAVGSSLWWGAARAAIAVSADHVDREERDMLAGWLPLLTTSQRLEFGRQWLEFTAAWRLEGTPGAASRPPYVTAGKLCRITT